MESGKAISLEAAVNQDKPKAYRSLPWPHLDELRKWRSAEETWEAIADKLLAQHGLKVLFNASRPSSNAQRAEASGGRLVLDVRDQVR
jgi:hypothetical protein